MLLKHFLVNTSLILLLFLPLSTIADHSSLSTDNSNSKSPAKQPITGAGAHFAWIIFNSLKNELQQTTGRDIRLYGKNSNLGMGCNAGIKLAQQNTHGHETFGFVCCPLSDEEIAEKNLIVYSLAEEPILILLNKKNPIENLSAEQVRSIFRGDIKNWAEVGGWDKPIAVVSRLHCKKRPGHWKTILPHVDDFTKNRLNVTSASEMEKLVTTFDTAIGHIGSTWKFPENSQVKSIKINNISATAENLKNESYPFHRRLSAVTNLNPSDDVLSAIKQVQYGSSFERVAKKYNLLPLNSTKP